MACCYLVDPKEMYSMTQMKKGLPHADMCNLIFRGSAKRWSPAWRWMLLYLDNHYRNIIGQEALDASLMTSQGFIVLYNKKLWKMIYATKLMGPWMKCRVSIFFLLIFLVSLIAPYNIDLSPISGPDGDYEGAPWQEQYTCTQKALYIGYIIYHGINVKTGLFSNGISTVFGLVSARHHDTASVLNMSGLNHFLIHIQRSKLYWYQLMGEVVFGMGFLEWMQSYFWAPLTPENAYCNAKLKSCRQSIEWSYGDISKIFSICDTPKAYMLAKIHMLLNSWGFAVCWLTLCNCLNDGKASGHKCFAGYHQLWKSILDFKLKLSLVKLLCSAN